MTTNIRIALGIEYDGSEYFGWQRQVDAASVQASLETALSKVADHPVQTICAGRTDTSVHGSGQVVHFETTAKRTLRAWVLGTNTNLPPSICVRWAKEVPEDFHARFSATARHYRYIIFNDPVRPAIYSKYVSWALRPLDEKKMQQAADAFIGEHDFSAFRASGCQAKTPIRTIRQLKVTRQGSYITVDVSANAFLHHMVRNIVGVLLSIGAGEEAVEWAGAVLAGQDRRHAGVTAPASGLYLVKVDYPEIYLIPTSSYPILPGKPER